MTLGGGVVFVVPRFHPNLAGAVRTLTQAGIPARILCAGARPLEDHEAVTPMVLMPDAPREEVWAALDRSGAGLALIRAVPGLSRAAEAWARRRGVRAFAYDLRPLTAHRPAWRRTALRLAARPWRRVTPVRGLDPAAATDAGAHYLPWPVARTDAEVGAMRGADLPLRILCVGKLHQPRKRQDLLLAAAEGGLAAGRMRVTLVGATHPDVAGADAAHYARLTAAAKHHPGRVVIRGDVPVREMAALYAAHDVCVLPAVGEPLGIAPVEAMAHGCVPVISDACGSAGYLRSGGDGLVVPADNCAALRHALEVLARNPAEAARLATGALRTAETELSPQRFLARLSALPR